MEKIKYYLKLFGFLLIFISVMQEESYSRQPAVAGQFYPAEPTELKNTIRSYFDKIKDR